MRAESSAEARHGMAPSLPSTPLVKRLAQRLAGQVAAESQDTAEQLEDSPAGAQLQLPAPALERILASLACRSDQFSA